MGYLTKSRFIKISSEVWEINTGEKLSPINTHQLKGIISQLNTMEAYYARVFVYRFDLHMDRYTATNEIISEFWERLLPVLKTKYKLKRIGYVWAREQEQAEWQHYHCALLIDGSKINFPKNLHDILIYKWMLANGGHVQRCGYKMLKRDDRHKKAEIIYWLSYLAKARGKGKRPSQTKDYGNSRIK